MLSTLLIIASVILANQAASLPKLSAPRFPINGRIVGGIAMTIDEIPYQVSLQHGLGHFCGGSIISNRWILSASHCVNNLQASRLKIRVGSSFRQTEGKLISVSNIISHPQYNNKTFDYDYALIELSEEIEFSKTVQSIGLPDQDEEIETGSKCLVSGWGDTKILAESREQLRAVVLPVVDRQKCQKQYESMNEITPRMICAGFEKGGKDSCK